MTTFKTYLLLEKFTNVFTDQEKERFAQQAYDLLTKTYEKIGGLKSSGLDSPEGLIHNTAFWKLYTKKGELKIVMIYKDRTGRKLVALATDGSSEAKEMLKSLLELEFQRSYIEVSGSLEAFIKKNFAEVYKSRLIPFERAKQILPDITPSKTDEYHYYRKIGDQHVEKMLIGTTGATVAMPDY